MSGLLQELVVASDHDGVLKIALQLPWQWHGGGATHYRVKREKDGSDKLCLYWAQKDQHDTPLPFPLKNSDALHAFASEWLRQSAKYPDAYPDTDGSVREGWRVTADDFYSIVEVKAEYIVYGK